MSTEYQYPSKEMSAGQFYARRSKSKEPKESRDASKDRKPKKENAVKSSTKSSSTEKKKTSSSEKAVQKSVKEAKAQKPPKKEPKSKPPPPPEPEPEEQYEDDFEDYSDDFEDDDEDEIVEEMAEEIHEEVENENLVERSEILTSAPVSSLNRIAERPRTPPQSAPSSERPPPAPLDGTPLLRRLAASRQGGRPPDPVPIPVPQPSATIGTKEKRISSADRKIDFRAASSVSYAAVAESEQRFRKLRQMITLDSVRYTILDQPAVKDFDFYMQMIGITGKSQAAAQTGDDDVDQEIQTDISDKRSIWAQYPATDEMGFGIENGSASESSVDDLLDIFRQNHMSNERLKKFVEAAAQTVIDLIAIDSRKEGFLELKHRSNMPFSTGFHIMNLKSLSESSTVVAFARNDQQPLRIAIAFYLEKCLAEDLVARTLIVEIQLDFQEPPNRLFVCNGRATSICYAPDGSALFAGLNDGTTLAFDLTEGDSMFSSTLPWLDCPNDLTLRLPAFDTSFLTATLSAGKAAPVVSMYSSLSSNTVQLAVLDESASVYIYAVGRTAGTRPDSRLALALAILLRPQPVIMRGAGHPTPLVANCLAAIGNGRLLVGTDAGFLCSVQRNKEQSAGGPRLYRSKMHAFGEVTCVRVSPFDDSVILVGFSTGSLTLHRVDQMAPVVVLTPPSAARKPVVAVEWSPLCSIAFYSIHAGFLLLWNIASGRSPVSINELSKNISGNVVTTHCWLQSTNDSAVAFMALGIDSGDVEIHALEPINVRQTSTIQEALREIEQNV